MLKTQSTDYTKYKQNTEYKLPTKNTNVSAFVFCASSLYLCFGSCVWGFKLL